MTIRLIVTLLFILYAVPASAQQPTSYDLQSPNGHVQLKIKTGDKLTYDLQVNNQPVMVDSSLSLDVDHKTLGNNPKVRSATPSAVERVVSSPVPQKQARIPEKYKELRLDLEGNYAIVFRAYDEGVAYRLETSLPQSSVKVYN